jgi:putative acetyltransferase
MKFERIGKEKAGDLNQLFVSTFASSEGAEEGALIGGLVSKLSACIDDSEIICFGAIENEQLIGAIFFTMLKFTDGAPIYMLAPVAVSTGRQKSGVGQALIRHGLNELANDGVLAAVTYGDPSFYGKTGFLPLSEDVLKAPLDLSMPHGWQGQSLSKEPIHARTERPSCVDAFHDPAYW